MAILYDGKGEIMRALLTLAAGRTRFLASPAEIAALLPKNLPHGDDAIDRGLSALSDGGYIDVVSTDRKGERTYAVELTGRGAGYFREALERRRILLFRVAVAALCGEEEERPGFLLKLIFT